MLIATRQIHGCSIEGADGAMGKVKDLLFDGESWKMLYLDVDTGDWLPGRHVLLSPEVIQCTDYVTRQLGTRLTREQVENSPPLEKHLPVSRKKEIEAVQYFAWDAYWANVELPTGESVPTVDPNLFSTHTVSGYRIETPDGKDGHVADFVVDDGTLEGVPWRIRYLVVDTRNWLPGRQVLVAPRYVESIDWNTRRVHIRLTHEEIANSQEYKPHAPINRRYEEVCHDYYGRPVHWSEVSHSV